MPRTVVITGVNAGIGRATARVPLTNPGHLTSVTLVKFTWRYFGEQREDGGECHIAPYVDGPELLFHIPRRATRRRHR